MILYHPGHFPELNEQLLDYYHPNEEKVLDILPLQDDRGIIPTKWTQSEKGRARVLNEMEQYSKRLLKKNQMQL